MKAFCEPLKMGDKMIKMFKKFSSGNIFQIHCELIIKLFHFVQIIVRHLPSLFISDEKPFLYFETHLGSSHLIMQLIV